MAFETLPDEISDFVRTNIDSVAELEALLLLRADPAADWGPDRVARHLYLGTRETVLLLEGLEAKGFLSDTGGPARVYRYSPNRHARRRIDELAEAYAMHLVAVTNLIHSKPHARATAG